MQRRDPLYAVELCKVLEEATSMLRHDVRNRMGSIRNMAFYVNKRVADSEVAKKDPRISQFLSKIEQEVAQADELIETWSASVARAHGRSVQPLAASKAIELAVSSARIPSALTVNVKCEDAMVEVDGLELALALRCLIENAAEAGGDGPIEVSARVDDGTYRLQVSDSGSGIADTQQALQCLQSKKPGHLGVGLSMAQRVALRAGGKLVIEANEPGARVTLLLPLAGSGTHPLTDLDT